MAYRIGADGRIVIPKALRDQLGLQPGVEVEFEKDGGALRVTARCEGATRGLRGRYAASGLAAALLEDRGHALPRI